MQRLLPEADRVTDDATSGTWSWRIPIRRGVVEIRLLSRFHYFRAHCQSTIRFKPALPLTCVSSSVPFFFIGERARERFSSHRAQRTRGRAYLLHDSTQFFSDKSPEKHRRDLCRAWHSRLPRVIKAAIYSRDCRHFARAQDSSRRLLRRVVKFYS